MIRNCIRLGRAISVLLFAIHSIFTSVAASAEEPGRECTGNFLGRKCTISSGKHVGFEIGMSKRDAFDNACRRAMNGRIWDPLLNANGAVKAYPGASMCDLKTEAMKAGEWSFVESAGIRERYIRLSFVDGNLDLIKLDPRGWDP